MKSPAFQFYPADFLSSGKVGQMTPIEVGIYVLLLCLDWSDGGFILDIPRLARWCRTDEPTFTNGWGLVRLCFIEKDGRWFNPRLQVEREKQESWREKSRVAGLKSGRARRKVANQPSEMVGTKREPKVNTPISYLLSPLTTTTQHTAAFANVEHRAAYERCHKAARSPQSFDAMLGTLHEPISGGAAFAWPIIGQALLELQSNGSTITANAIRAFCRKLTQPDVPNGKSRKGNITEGRESLAAWMKS